MFIIKINTDNAAFGGQPEYELVRILAEVAERVGQEEKGGDLHDANGNYVGMFTLTTRKAVTR